MRTALSHIEIAIRRARGGENFNIGLVMGRDGTLDPVADWQAAPVSDDAAQILSDYAAATGPRAQADAVMQLPAGRLIRELLTALGA